MTYTVSSSRCENLPGILGLLGQYRVLPTLELPVLAKQRRRCMQGSGVPGSRATGLVGWITVALPTHGVHSQIQVPKHFIGHFWRALRRSCYVPNMSL